jgi:hypothetical protein
LPAAGLPAGGFCYFPLTGLAPVLASVAVFILLASSAASSASFLALSRAYYCSKESTLGNKGTFLIPN